MHSSNQGGITDKHSNSFIQSTDKEVLDSNQNILLEPVQVGSYDVSYTCFLIPRIPSQQLIGKLADYLPQWLEEICTSSKWKLEFVSIKPDYLQWALSVYPIVPTGHIIQHVRSQISELIFANFSQFKKENTSNDFWASGYLILSGIHPHPREVIEHYIRLMRQ